MLVTLLLGAVMMAAGLVAAAPASACSCVAGTTQEFFDRADAVFTGRLLSREEPQGSVISTADPALHVFAVDTVVKGTAEQRQEILSPMSGASCGLGLTGTGPFVVFGTRSSDPWPDAAPSLADDQYRSSLCGGTAPLTPELEAELAALAGPSAAPPADPLPGATGTTTAGSNVLVPAVVGTGALALLLGGGLLLRRRQAPDGTASSDHGAVR
jgi:hypothetical protein